MTTVETVDIGWLLLCSALVLFMQAGFTALESGLVRSKNSINVPIKNFANFLVAASLFWLFGFGLMFGAGEGSLIGFVDFAGSAVVHSVGGWVVLAAIIILGPRIGRFGTRAVPIRADYLPLTTVGVLVLWVGWYGFN